MSAGVGVECNDVDDYCLKRNKWGGFEDRLAEQRRIFASVREEHLEVLRKFEETSHEFAKLMQLIPQKQDELEQLNQKIEMLKLAARELQDQRNVRLFLPHAPLWPPKTTDRRARRGQYVPPSSFCFHFSSRVFLFVSSRCSISTRFRVFVYEKKSFADEHAARLYDQLRKLPYRTEDPTKACVFAGIVEKGDDPRRLSEWKESGRNHLLFLTTPADSADFGAAIVVAENLTNPRKRMDHQLMLDVDALDSAEWTKLPALLPRDNKFLLSYQSTTPLTAPLIAEDLERLTEIGRRFAGRRGHSSLPFDGLLDWRLAVVQLPLARLPEVHFIARSFSTADTLEMRRKGRFFLENYLINSKDLMFPFSSRARRLSPPSATRCRCPARTRRTRWSPLRPSARASRRPKSSPITPKPGVLLDEEYVGALEQPIDSAAYHSNMSAIGMYTYKLWNEHPHFVDASPEFLAFAAALPSGAEFDEAASSGMRPIAPGSGQEFSLAFGRQPNSRAVHHRHPHAQPRRRAGGDPREDQPLPVRQSRARRLEQPRSGTARLVAQTPRARPLHPAERNSLNNRFLPYDQIRTEAVLSLDDDIDFKAPEIVFAFRVWRENRSGSSGCPPATTRAYGDELFYNSNHTCQLSMILTGAAFLHKSYLYAYSNQMPAIIREKVDEWMNCEDLAMNFLVAHLTRRPPIKATNKWTIRCPTCPETLSSDAGHFDKRSRCIRFFIEVYGYNPLMFTQFRADSVLYRTRVPVNHQKCFRFRLITPRVVPLVSFCLVLSIHLSCCCLRVSFFALLNQPL
ncbi:Exostosin-like 3 [Aphelenchoides fujianensis]|nr:Exostosin-like 3 [Aphelenchoides fujianensis]